jgi:hypothetical protein
MAESVVEPNALATIKSPSLRPVAAANSARVGRCSILRRDDPDFGDAGEGIQQGEVINDEQHTTILHRDMMHVDTGKLKFPNDLGI